MVSQKIKLSEKQLKAAGRLLDKCEELRKEFDRKAIDPGTQDYFRQFVNFCNENSEGVNNEFEKIFDELQQEQLFQLGNQIALRRFGFEAVAPLFAFMDGVQSDFSVSEYEDLRAKLQTVRNAHAQESWSPRFRRGLLSAWLREGFVKEQDVRELYAKYAARISKPLDLHVDYDLRRIEECDSPKGIKTMELLETTCIFRVLDTGVAERSIEHVKKRGSLIFLQNLKDSRFAAQFELTEFQKEESKKMLEDFERDVENRLAIPEVDKVVDLLFLPHQKDLYEDYLAWREVDVFGLPICLLEGRLGKRLKLDAAAKSRLRDSAGELIDDFQKLIDDFDAELWERCDDMFIENGYPVRSRDLIGDIKWDFSKFRSEGDSSSVDEE